MNTRKEEILKFVEKMYLQPELYKREYFKDFTQSWDAAFKQAFAMNASYLPENPDAVLAVEHTFEDLTVTWHFDQLKIYDWFQKEMEARSKNIFTSKKLKRSMNGVLSYDETVCTYDPKLPEPALTEKMRNVIACALPGLPNPELKVVYGNKWVNKRFNPFRIASLQLYLINTDYVPAFLGDPVEVCLYLFMMDCCIIKLNHEYTRDKDLKPLLHIFRRSPMLVVKGIVK